MAIALEGLELSRFFVAVLMLLFFAYLFGYLFNRLKMPKTVGEIVGGILLGPTLLGYIFPSFFQDIFLSNGKLLAILYWLGLILLMFSSGFEVQNKYDPSDKKTVLMITVLSTIIPFVVGWFISDRLFDLTTIVGIKNNISALKIIIATSIAVTSIPVISKIFFDLGIMKTRFAKIVLGAATVHDVILWIFIAIATGLVSANIPTIFSMFWHVVITILFFCFALFLVPKVLDFMRRHPRKIVPVSYEFGFVFLVILFFVILANYLDINIVFGAFLAGIVIGFIRKESFKEIREKIKDFSFAFFIPIYFAIVGIKIDLVHSLDIPFFLLFLVVATVIQGASVLLACRIMKHSWLSSFNLAIAMNARGGPGIVVATIAFETGIINESFFVTLILVAIFTSLIAGVWLRYVLSKGWPLLEEKKDS